jgi:hypothetical protein
VAYFGIRELGTADGKSGVIEKYESRRIRVEIRHVLMDVWDPIGVKDEPNAQDEYDAYLGGVYDLLVSGASDENIQAHLWRIVTERMGLSPKKSDMADTVKALRQIPLPRNSK